MAYSKEEAKEKIKQLIETFKRRESEGVFDKNFNEERTKSDLLDPLFEYLNWDVRNLQNEEVVREQRVAGKRADYAFKLGGITKFILEAKKINEDIENTDFINQAINYGWHKGAAWVILSNFRHLMVFNCEVKESDPRKNIVLNVKMEDFLADFDDIWRLSKDGFAGGLMEIWAEKYAKMPKRIPIDEQLLKDFMLWRTLLFKNIKSHNKGFENDSAIDDAVQKILDRLIFIRKAEDSKLVDERRLWQILRQSEGKDERLYRLLQKVFREFEEGYDSDLFVKSAVDEVVMTDDVLKGVLEGLYQTGDRMMSYDFSLIDADVLGSVYEQYLGHILKKAGKGAKLEEGKAHRKEQGIYYTPTYIVDYIVKNTLGEMIKNKKPEEVEKIRVLDMACGSGSFLIKAFDVMDEWFKDKTKSDSFMRRSKILTDNIFGVDLDEKAVMIAQLNLMLKAAEKKHKLPMLRKNIQVGNSLIDDEKVAGDKAFKWEERFKNIVKNKGFDVIIGNPPYGAELSQNEKDFSD